MQTAAKTIKVTLTQNPHAGMRFRLVRRWEAETQEQADLLVSTWKSNIETTNAERRRQWELHGKIEGHEPDGVSRISVDGVLVEEIRN